MKPIQPTPDWLKHLCLEDLDQITQILSQLRGDYETSTNQPYVHFIFSLEIEIEKLLSNTQLTWEQIFDLWEDQRIVREAIMDEYITFYC